MYILLPYADKFFSKQKVPHFYGLITFNFYTLWSARKKKSLKKLLLLMIFCKKKKRFFKSKLALFIKWRFFRKPSFGPACLNSCDFFVDRNLEVWHTEAISIFIYFFFLQEKSAYHCSPKKGSRPRILF